MSCHTAIAVWQWHLHPSPAPAMTFWCLSWRLGSFGNPCQQFAMISSLGSQTLHCRAIWMLISPQSRAIFYNLYPVMVFASRSGFAMAEMFHCLKSKLMTIVAPAYLVLTSETTKPKQNLCGALFLMVIKNFVKHCKTTWLGSWVTRVTLARIEIDGISMNLTALTSFLDTQCWDSVAWTAISWSRPSCSPHKPMCDATML